MKQIFIGSIILTIIAAGMFSGWVVVMIALILTFVNIVMWIVAAPQEDDVWPVIADEFEAEDGA